MSTQGNGIVQVGALEPGRTPHIPGDTAYDGDETREVTRQFRAKACVKSGQNGTNRMLYDKQLYQRRNPFERFFDRNPLCRRVSTRYEKSIETHAGSVRLAALVVNVSGTFTRSMQYGNDVAIRLEDRRQEAISL